MPEEMPGVVKEPAEIQRRVDVTTGIKENAQKNRGHYTLIAHGIVPFFFISRIAQDSGLEFYPPLIGLVASVLYSFSEEWHEFFNKGLEWAVRWTFAVTVVLLFNKSLQFLIFP